MEPKGLSSLNGTDKEKNMNKILVVISLGVICLFVLFAGLCLVLYALDSQSHERTPWEGTWEFVVIVLALGLAGGMCFHGFPFQFKVDVYHEGDEISFREGKDGV